MELLPAGGQQLDVCGTHSSHSIKTSTHDVPLEPSWTVSPDGNNLEVFNCFQGRLWLQLTRAPERRSDERSWRRPVRLADSRCSSTTMRRDGISIQPPSEGELHAKQQTLPLRGGMGPAGCRPACRTSGRLQKTNVSFTEHQQSENVEKQAGGTKGRLKL